MKNSVLIKIEEWKKENDLTRKSKYEPILDAYRRINQFGKKDINYNMALLELPSSVKEISHLITPSFGTVIPRVLNWFKLNEEGKKVILDLMNRIVWNEKEMNEEFFN